MECAVWANPPSHHEQTKDIKEHKLSGRSLRIRCIAVQSPAILQDKAKHILAHGLHMQQHTKVLESAEA